ncbi:2676_t:CDS:2 [Dentiscutata heterogama]|uniref:2676_t:CDS:1 n=1 Tax=Dentiscutata heterogama TaxID=1316150 RepID=A0ACA9KSJ2_9GLOM|nr:2676_t:CDS:2 [Dentiscutata heterogama]
MFKAVAASRSAMPATATYTTTLLIMVISWQPNKDMANLLTIILPILIVFLAIVYTLYKDFVVTCGYYREPAQKYTGGKCRRLEGLEEACEDIKIHHTSGLAYFACGNAEARTTQWFPPMGLRHNYSYQPKDTFYVYNIETSKLTPLTLKNFDEDFALHGFGMYEDPSEPDIIYFFIINHKRTGSVIELFKHKINSFELHHLKTFKHKLIYNPNNVAPVSKDEFYITNDYYYQTHWKRLVESLTLRKWGNVVFHSSKTNTTEIVVDGLAYANGINVNWDYSRIYVGTIGTGELLIYERKPDNKLKLLEAIKIEHPIDNVNVDPVTGEIYLAAIYNMLDAYLSLIGKDTKPAFSIFKVSNNTGEDRFYGIKYSKEKIFEDDGTLLRMVSVAAGDSVRKVVFFGSPHNPGVVRCELD